MKRQDSRGAEGTDDLVIDDSEARRELFHLVEHVTTGSGRRRVIVTS